MSKENNNAQRQYRFDLRVEKTIICFAEYNGPGLGSCRPKSRRFILKHGILNSSSYKVLFEWYKATTLHGDGSQKDIMVSDMGTLNMAATNYVQSNVFSGSSIVSLRFYENGDNGFVESVEFLFSTCHAG